MSSWFQTLCIVSVRLDLFLQNQNCQILVKKIVRGKSNAAFRLDQETLPKPFRMLNFVSWEIPA